MEGERLSLKDGAVIFDEGADSDQAFIIENGQVRIEKVIGGTRHELAVLDTGELFGEMGVIDGSPRSAKASAKGPCVLTAIRGDHFLRTISKDPAFAASVMGKLVERLRHTTMLVENEAAGRPTVSGSGKFDGDTWGLPAEETVGETLDTTEVSSPDSELEVLATETPQPPELTDTSVQGPQRSLPPELAEALTQPAAAHPNDTSVPGAISFLLPYPAGDEKDSARKTLMTLVDGLLPTQAACPKAPEIEIVGSEYTAPLGGVFDIVRKAALAARLPLSLMVRTDGSHLRVRFLAPWPDDEAKLGGFSALDELIIPTDKSDHVRREFLACAIAAASQSRDPTIANLFHRLMPPDFASIKQLDTLPIDGLAAEDVARQFSVLGCIFARMAVMTEADGRYRDALLSYETALAALSNTNQPRLRGIILLHLVILLSTTAERSEDPTQKQRARELCAEAAACFDPTDTPYQYVTAWARLGAIHYRAALDSGDIEDCKQGLQAFRTALKACDRRLMAEPWADVMNGLGQLLILMGKISRSTEFITWAAQVYTNATEVRSKDANLTGWARTINNLGSALYLISKAKNDAEGFKVAISRFDEAEKVFEQHRIAGMAETCKRNRLLVLNYLQQYQKVGKAPFDWWMEGAA